MKGDTPEIEIGSGSNSVRWRSYVAATNYDGSVCAFAVKPRAFGAPDAALGLDGSAQPSKGRPLPQGHLLTW